MRIYLSAREPHPNSKPSSKDNLRFKEPKMISLYQSKNVNLDKLFALKTQVDRPTSKTDDKEILTEAVTAIADSSSGQEKEFRLFDPNIAKVSRLASNEPLSSWIVRAAGLVSETDVLEAFELSLVGQESIIEILQKAGKLSHSDVVAVQQAEALVLEGILYRGFAASALKLAAKEYITFVEAMELLDLHPQKPFMNNTLVKALGKINFLDKDSLLSARQEALSKGITIGWSLIKNNLVDEQLVKVIIECNFAIRDNQIDPDEMIATAVLAISSQTDTGNYGQSPESILVSELNVTTLDRVFGNLLLGSSILGIEELLFCAEVALEEEFMLEQVVERFNLIDPLLLNGSCKLARMLLNKSISAKNCTIMLEKLKSTGQPLSELMNTNESPLEFTVPPSNTLTARTA